MSEFDEGMVPSSVPQVHEYEFCRTNYTEKAQTALYEFQAAVASLRLLQYQMKLHSQDLERNMEDIDDVLKGVD